MNRDELQKLARQRLVEARALLRAKCPALVSTDIENGRGVLEALDEGGVDVRAALWLYVPEASEWRLVLAIPVVDREGPRAGYLTDPA